VTSDVDRRQQFQTVVGVVYEPLQRFFGRRVRPEDVSDLLNDALLVIWRRLDEVPSDHPLPWSYAVAHRCLANHRRGERRRLRLVDRLAAQPRRHETLTNEAGHLDLTTALAELDEADRELLRLWAWEQLEPREIAVVLDTTPNAVSLRLGRAKKKVAASVERQNRASAGQEGFGHGREPRS
jgi:RNA polymerase sigma-70 factor (ECF subfamily)